MVKTLTEEEFFGLANEERVKVANRFTKGSIWYSAKVARAAERESSRPTLACIITDSRWKREPDQYYSPWERNLIQKKSKDL